MPSIEKVDVSSFSMSPIFCQSFNFTTLGFVIIITLLNFGSWLPGLRRKMYTENLQQQELDLKTENSEIKK